MRRNALNSFSLLALRRQYKQPHAWYNALREHDRVHFDETSQSWLVTGYDAVVEILDDARFTSRLASVGTMSNLSLQSVSKQLLFMDGAPHHQAQQVMLKALAQIVKRIPPVIRHYVQSHLDALRKAGEMDAVRDFAGPVSLLTIAHILGMPTHDMAELQQLERWSDTFGDITSGYFSSNLQDVKNLEEYFRRLIVQKRHASGDDVLSALLAAGAIFPQEDDLIVNCMMLFAAGRITTKKLLGNGISLLIPDWDQWQMARQENARFPRLLGEELLRMVTPTRYLVREASVDVQLSSLHRIGSGQKMLLFLEAANYDPTIFSQPDQLQPQRRPNKHVAFGYGPHQCPGATLARVEIQIALEGLLALSDIRSKPGSPVTWNANPNLGGFASNPVLFV